MHTFLKGELDLHHSPTLSCPQFSPEVIIHHPRHCDRHATDAAPRSCDASLPLTLLPPVNVVLGARNLNSARLVDDSKPGNPLARGNDQNFTTHEEKTVPRRSCYLG